MLVSATKSIAFSNSTVLGYPEIGYFYSEYFTKKVPGGTDE